MEMRVLSDGDNLEKMRYEVDQWCQQKGWRDTPVTFLEAMALLHTEVSEAVEAYRQWQLGDVTPPNGKPEGIGSEFADILIRLLDNCSLFGVELFAEYRRKMNYNYTREYRHGGKAL